MASAGSCAWEPKLRLWPHKHVNFQLKVASPIHPYLPILASLARRYETFQRLFDGGLEVEAEFVTRYVSRSWWTIWRGDANTICRCLLVLLEKRAPMDFLSLPARGKWTT
jgi:hypothetical protein